MTVRVPTRFGLEFELEDVRHDDNIPGNWQIVPEHSLRGGLEFVMQRPRPREAALTECTELFTALAKRFSATFRCSTHVHVDMREMTIQQVQNFYIYAVCWEKKLWEKFPSRSGNMFCVPTAYSPLFIAGLQEILRMDRGFAGHMPGLSVGKYTGINVRPYHAQGSIEFRHFPVLDTVKDRRYVLTTLFKLVQLSAAINPVTFDTHDDEDVEWITDQHSVFEELDISTLRWCQAIINNN